MESVKLQTWFTQYKSFSENLSQNIKARDLLKFRTLLQNFTVIQNEIKKMEIKDPHHYNVFYLMRYIVDREETLHSPFLADLFNINGKHKQNGLFYNEFIKQLDLGNNKMFEVDEMENIFFSSCTEKWTGDGAIDIFIELNSPERKFAIAIENKIFAPDQPNQLQRYAGYLERNFGENYLLLYLTPTKRMPKIPFSIPQDRYDELIKRKLLKLITYKKHISYLLENTIPKIESPKVESIATQYFHTIKNNFNNEYQILY